MARKKKHPEHVNHERWLVSYADFITLLFAFFVVMFAVSQVDSKKVGRFTEAFSKAVGIDIFPQSGTGLLPGSEVAIIAAQAGVHDELSTDMLGLKDSLTLLRGKHEQMKGLQILRHRNELVLRLPENVFFASGDDTVKEGAARVLQAVAGLLKDRKVDIRVEGHTDDRPIRTPRFHSNWDLSTARATAVIRTLNEEGIEPTRLSAAGYGEFRPIASNDTDDGRKQNRRVDLVISEAIPSSPAETKEETKESEGPKDSGADEESGARHEDEHAKDGGDDAAHEEESSGHHGEESKGEAHHGEEPKEAAHHDESPKGETHPAEETKAAAHADEPKSGSRHGDASKKSSRRGDAPKSGHGEESKATPARGDEPKPAPVGGVKIAPQRSGESKPVWAHTEETK